MFGLLDSAAIMTALFGTLLIASLLLVVFVIRAWGPGGNAAGAAAQPSANTALWPSAAEDELEPYHLYFEQLNSMLEPIEPFNLEQFKANCSVPTSSVTVSFNSEGGFKAEPIVKEAERR